MINKRFSKLGILTLCTVFALTGINTVEQLLSLNGKEAGYSNRVLAQTSDESLNRRVYQKASPAVVTVKTETGHGSGFVISQDGLIITNAHVIKPPPRLQPKNEAEAEYARTYNPAEFPQVVTVVFTDGRKFSADVMGFGKGGLDLAVLKIHGQKNLHTLPLATPGSAKVGDRVFALGTPLDAKFEGTFTQGNITRIDPSDGEIQHNAVIMGGNSGGPLLNSQGQVIGVNTSGIGELNTGMNFSIPVSQVQSFIVAARKKDVSPVSTLFTRTQEPSIRTITLNGQVINGSLTKGDRTLEDGSFADGYQFQGKKGQQVVIEMTSQKINPVLSLFQVVESTEGQQLLKIAENDDRGAGDFNAQITMALPADGVFFIIANSLDRGEIGDYSLRANSQP
ncbi:S1C family serine protease [Brunnivagina elsteri]|uniref:Serine protease n=1 Tax=Brunnivagina elsteri CCALA 953 TaxID=987040 RepID=A0A2A2TFI3_9CYAN|nr:S1C family serine protease [Calothrix elsteri]PAX52179.1 serine protease [Calothrix elsteri CCALA 953]